MSRKKSARFLARLVRGQTYILGDKRFDAGKPVEVTAGERSHLEQFAVDHQTVPGRYGGDELENVVHQKFKFEEVENDQD